MTHPVMTQGRVALVTGGAGGIGLAAARAFAQSGMRVAIVDADADKIAAAEAALREAAREPGDVLARVLDVTRPADLDALAQEVGSRFGGVDLLMANAGIQPGSALFGDRAAWERVLAVNLWGVIDTVRAFAPAMIAGGRDGLIVVTGSKQGITTPPGDPAYNISKAGVKVFAEQLAHELRRTPGCRIGAHLLVPGFVFTDLTARGRTEKPAGAWTPEETVAFMIERIAAGDFYVLCPDNEVDRALDEKRIAWAAGDIVENRPALSRWHPDYEAAFADFLRGDGTR